MIKLTSAALFFLAAGIFTSVTILSAYQVLFAIPLIYFTYISFKTNDYRLPKSAYWLLAFALVALISSSINFEIIPKPSKNFGRIKYFLFGAFGIFTYRYWLEQASTKTKNIIVNTLFLSIVVSAMYPIWQIFVAGVPRAKGLTESMRYGYGTGMALLVILSSILNYKKMPSWFTVRWAIIAFIFGFIGMYFTYTRGALLGFLCGLPFCLYFYKKKLGLTLGSIAVLIVLTLGGLYFFGSGKYESRFLASKNNYSDNIRRSQWESAVYAIKEKPVLGWGLSNFHTQVARIKDEHNLNAKYYVDAHAHNVFLEVAAGTGLIGLFFFLGWLVNWAYECFRAGGLIKALVVPLGVAYVVCSQFEVTMDANNSSMIFTLYSLSAALYNKSMRTEN